MTPKQKAKKWNKPPHRGWLLAHDPEAFEVFFRTRKFTEVAREFKVSPAAVGKHADRHDWIDRLAQRLEKIEEKTTDKLSDMLARDTRRQYQIFSLVEVNALNKLRKPDLKAGESVKASELMMTAEAASKAVHVKRLLAGEPTEHYQVTWVDIIKAAHDRRAVLQEKGPQG